MFFTILAQTDVKFWESIINGPVGFVLGVGFCTFIFVWYILPRWDKQTAAIEKLGEAVRMLVGHVLESDGKKPTEILHEMDKISGR